MKKKKLSYLQLNKKSISNLNVKQVKGGGVSVPIELCYYPVKWGFEIGSYILGCTDQNDDDDNGGTFNSCACANTQNDETCQCTIA